MVNLASLLSVPEGISVTIERVDGPMTRNGTVIWGAPSDPALLNLPNELQPGWVDLDLASTRGIAALPNGTVVTWGAPDASSIPCELSKSDRGTSREFHLRGSRDEIVNHVPAILSASGT